MSQVFSTTRAGEPHLVSRLGLRAREVDDGLEGQLAIRADLQGAGGAPLLGPVGSFVDTIGGVRAAIATFPTAIATADLGLAIDPAARPREIVTRPRVLRAGKTNVVTEMVLTDAQTGVRVGYSTMTSAVLSTAIPQEYDPRVVTQMFRADYTPSDSLYTEMGLEWGSGLGDDAAPGARLGLLPWLGNAMGMLHGGCTFMITEAAAFAAGAEAFGAAAPLAVVDAHVRYLNGARAGPVVATATPLGRDRDSLTVQVTQRDDGTGRTTAVSTARVIRAARSKL